MNRSGLSLIEVIISLLLSTMLMGIFYTAFFQSNRIVSFVDRQVDLDTVSVLVLSRMATDLSATCSPLVMVGAGKESDQKDTVKKESGGRGPVFKAVVKDKRLELLSFITMASAFRGMEGLKPLPVRVTYRVRENKEKKDAFVLVRQESSRVAQDPLASSELGTEIEVARSLKALSLEFVYTDTAVKEKKRAVHTTSEWDSDVPGSRPVIPGLVRLHMTIADERFEKERTYEYAIPVLAEVSVHTGSSSQVVQKQEAVQPPAVPGTPATPTVPRVRPLPAQPQPLVSLGEFRFRPRVEKQSFLQQMVGVQ